MACEIKSSPVYFVKEAPNGWGQALLAYNRRYQDSASLTASQKRNWQAEVGQQPEDCAFTLVVPIHNEERSLPSVLAALMHSDIPSDTNLNVVFVTNACTDQSSKIVKEFMGNFEGIKSPIEEGFKDLQVAHIPGTNHTFWHIDTVVPGKANALNVGNRVALELGHKIVMSADANNYLEPGSLRAMYRDAHQAFCEEKEVGLLCGKSVITRRDSPFIRFIKTYHPAFLEVASRKDYQVCGWLMAWDALLVDQLGGFPETATEDYAMGLVVRDAGYKISQVEDAKAWGFGANNFSDVLAERARYLRGGLQIIRSHPEVAPRVEEEFPYTKAFLGRLDYYNSLFRRSPLIEIPVRIAGILIWEMARLKGQADLKIDPTNQSWTEIKSTK